MARGQPAERDQRPFGGATAAATHDQRTAWVCRSRQELEAASPSRRDGISAEREEAKRFAYSGLIQDAGMALKIPQPSIGAAAWFCHRYFAARSMRSNDTWVVATACMFLACKVTEVPKALRDVIQHMWMLKHKGRVTELEFVKDREWMEKVKAAVIKAERTLLYTLHFNFDVALTPYFYALSHIKQFALTTAYPELPQVAWDLVNTSWRSNMCLQFTFSEIGAGALYTALHMLKIDLPTASDATGRTLRWYQVPVVGMTTQQIREVSFQLLEVLEKFAKLKAMRLATKRFAAAQAAAQLVPARLDAHAPQVAGAAPEEAPTERPVDGRPSRTPAPVTPAQQTADVGRSASQQDASSAMDGTSQPGPAAAQASQPPSSSQEHGAEAGAATIRHEVAAADHAPPPPPPPDGDPEPMAVD